MTSECTLFIDRLQSGKTEKIKETLSSEFLEIHEPELTFSDKIFIDGEAYLANEHLIIQLEVKLHVIMPCSICNNPTEFPLELHRFYHTEEINQIKSHIYNYSSALREAILLEVPSFVECRGNCPERGELKKYIHQDNPKKLDESVQFPFAEL